MIKRIKLDGVTRIAIFMDELIVPGDVRELRSALLDCLETCLASEKSKRFTKAESLRYMVRLIDETTV